MGGQNYMQGMLTYLDAWLIYIAAGLMGWWCWYRLFFWLKAIPFAQHLMLAVGAVLLFTPAPINANADQYAPAFIITAFSLLAKSTQSMSYIYFYWLCAALIVTLVLMLIYSLLYKFKKKPATATEKEPDDA